MSSRGGRLGDLRLGLLGYGRLPVISSLIRLSLLRWFLWML
ncbi:hypothetical protein A2U01_0062062, partial [Trifolium medium]|nr:hypothetical protein [Trifolium medium]